MARRGQKPGGGRKGGGRGAKTAPKRSKVTRVTTRRAGSPAPKSRTKAPKAGPAAPDAKPYTHPEATSLLRPDVGTQPQFKKRKPAATYRYDSSLSPALNWDGQNPAREQGEWLLSLIERASTAPEQNGGVFPATMKNARGEVVMEVRSLREATERLRALSRPFLDWAGKAERLSFDVPTLPLFVHERLSTKAILETLKGHRRDQLAAQQFDLFADPQLPIHEQVLKAYEHSGGWTNRMILGDSLVVMNSLLRYESLGGQVQMIYIDPPYGIKYGSNFQPFIRKRDVKHNDDEDMTREPEMVKAYRDTWELGLHSYLTYLRDRLLVARELLAPSGSVFVQISDENLHYVRELMDEVFGAANFIAVIKFVKTSGSTADYIPGTMDYLLWYSRDCDRLYYCQLYLSKEAGGRGGSGYNRLEFVDGRRRQMSKRERLGLDALPDRARIYCLDNLTSQSIGREKGEGAACWFPIQINGREYLPNMRSRWKTNAEGMANLLKLNRVEASGERVGYVRYLDDFPFFPLGDSWDDVMPSFMVDKLYVVQTATSVIERCVQMTTRPGDLVLDPTCGSGTTAYVAEQWGRRWITIDTSRVPLALARQRLLTATFDYYELEDEKRGPAGGFTYKRKQNQKGEEVGGIVPHVTLKSIANNEPPAEEVLVDRPEKDGKTVRVTGPFCFEGTIPNVVDPDDSDAPTSPVRKQGDEEPGVGARGSTDADATYSDRMLEVLRRCPVLEVSAGKKVTLTNVRKPAKTLSLSAEAVQDDAAKVGVPPTQGHLADEAGRKPVAILFGPENGAITEKSVFEAAKEASAKGYKHLYVIGFAIQPNARLAIAQSDAGYGVPATFIEATMDLTMGDLLKNMRSSQIFSVSGLPDVVVHRIDGGKGEPARYQVELRGLDVFDPTTMTTEARRGDDVPAWFLDTDYNGLCFHVCQAFFPRTAAWDDLKRALKAEYAESVWDHLAGAKSTEFEAGEHKQVAVKVIDDRGNELMVVKSLDAK